MLIAILCALAAILAAPAQAGANENFAGEPPFGGHLPPQLVHPPSERKPPAGFRLSGRQAIRVANGATAVRDERAQNPNVRAAALERGHDWQVNYFVGPRSGRTAVAPGRLIARARSGCAACGT